eukprot:TRINITY_DN27978_c0_g1_i1.p1 TRINITY_DN27978_c0_g1~~TRINITY_DN27978_c0_g1_i1.p1  ORF type:complete len:709 (+),score=183.82 TRINITY_DN27978_c0_g1_i1:91-2217(+)
MSSSRICAICGETLSIRQLCPCDHSRVCHLCSLRMRVQGKDLRCSFCKAVLPYVVYSFSERPWSSLPVDLRAAKDVFYDDLWRIYVDNPEVMKEITSLRKPMCPVCGDDAFSHLRQLKQHLQDEHERFYCDLCMRYSNKFLSELPVFTSEELKRHLNEGDGETVAETNFRGHPRCPFDGRRFYSSDELIEHMRTSHEQCFLCSQEGNFYQFFKDFSALEGHYGRAHFLCPHLSCRSSAQGIFATERELVSHLEVAHNPHNGVIDLHRIQQASDDRWAKRHHTRGRTRPAFSGVADLLEMGLLGRIHDEDAVAAGRGPHVGKGKKREMGDVEAAQEMQRTLLEEWKKRLEDGIETGMKLDAPPLPSPSTDLSEKKLMRAPWGSSEVVDQGGSVEGWAGVVAGAGGRRMKTTRADWPRLGSQAQKKESSKGKEEKREHGRSEATGDKGKRKGRGRDSGKPPVHPPSKERVAEEIGREKNKTIVDALRYVLLEKCSMDEEKAEETFSAFQEFSRSFLRNESIPSSSFVKRFVETFGSEHGPLLVELLSILPREALHGKRYEECMHRAMDLMDSMEEESDPFGEKEFGESGDDECEKRMKKKKKKRRKNRKHGAGPDGVGLDSMSRRKDDECHASDEDERPKAKGKRKKKREATTTMSLGEFRQQQKTSASTGAGVGSGLGLITDSLSSSSAAAATSSSTSASPSSVWQSFR